MGAGCPQGGFNQNFNPNFMYYMYMKQQNEMRFQMMYRNMLMNLYQKMNQLAMMRNLQNNGNNNFTVQGGANTYVSKKTILPNNFNTVCDPFFYSNSRKLNIVFSSTGNFKLNMYIPIDAKMKDVFQAFIDKVGLQKEVLGTYIYFLFNGLTIPIKSEKTISEVGIYADFTTILVIDTSNLLGA